MIKKLEKLFFYALIFSIPFQTRLILRSWGIGFNEWNAAFLYFTDLLILAVLGLWFLRFFTNKKAPIVPAADMPNIIGAARSAGSGLSSRNRHYAPPRANLLYQKFDLFLMAFLIISAISIKNTSNPAPGFYQLVKLLEFSLLYFYVKSNFNTVFNLATAFFVFLASGIFQAVLSIFQYIKQSDLGLRFLGETVLNPDLFNVATFLVNGEKVMRSYGTAPHPNVLAFILFIGIFIYYLLFIQRFNKAKNEIWFWLAGYAVLLFGFLFTFSRIIIFVWLVGLIYRFGWLYWKKEFRGVIQRADFKKLILATFVIMFVFSLLFWPQVLARMNISFQEEAVSLRGFYNQLAFEEKPFFGVGFGNFVNWLKETDPGLTPNLYQPVHNIYLLIFSETGILGLTMFLLFLLSILKKSIHNSYFIIPALLLFFGLFDHFLWTLQQGRIILWLILGLIAAPKMRP